MTVKRKTKRGRPSRAEASAKALAAVDGVTLDPRTVLMAIANDASAPATARVQACRALLQIDGDSHKDEEHDSVITLALQLLAAK